MTQSLVTQKMLDDARQESIRETRKVLRKRFNFRDMKPEAKSSRRKESS